MSTKIDLTFFKMLDLEMLEKGVEVWLNRIIADVRFKKEEGWSRSYDAVLDTGAPVSMIPRHIWSNIDVETVSETKIKGIVSKKDCFIPVKVGYISCVFLDEKSVSKEKRLIAYLSSTDEIPLILGFQDIITDFQLFCDYAKKIAWFKEE